MATFKGKETKFDLYLVVEPRGKGMYKWVIADVAGEIFNLKPSRESDKIMLLPNEHESNFMRLNSLTNEKDDYITLYSENSYAVDRMTVFNTLVYYGYLNIEYVDDISYTFLQVPGYAFTVREFERESTNSGWLIESWIEMSDTEKELIKNQLHNDIPWDEQTNKLEVNNNSSTSSKNAEKAKSMVIGFVNQLNKIASNKAKANTQEIESLVKGRYSFIVSDLICDELAKTLGRKVQDSYRLDSVISMLQRTNCPITSFEVNDLELFDNENIRPEYADGYTLIKGELSAKGNFNISEQVVFFIYEDQIAGIKLISNCF